MLRFVIPVWFRRPWLAWLVGVLIVLPLAVLAWFYWWLLPNLPAHKDQVASVLSSATGYTITLERIQGEWGGARPRFVLEGVRVAESERPMLYFSRIDARFGWRSLLTLEPRFHALSIEAPALTVRRARDGFFYAGGLKIDPNSADTSFSDWLLKQGTVSVRGATVAWVDETLSAPPLVFTQVSAELENLFTRHRVEVGLAPPAWMAKPLKFSGVFYGRSFAQWEAWRGKASLDVPAIEFARWKSWMPQSAPEVVGHGSLAANLDIQSGKMQSLSTQLNLADMAVRHVNLPSAFLLKRAVGEAGWTLDKSSMQTAWVRGMSLGERNGTLTAPLDLAWSWGEREQGIRARNLDLAQLAALAETLPLADAHKASLRQFKPRGRIDLLEASWQLDSPPAMAPNTGQTTQPLPATNAADFRIKAFQVEAGFTGLSWNPDGDIPGAANLSGRISGHQDKGEYRLHGQQAGFDFPGIFADPALRFDSLNLRGGWSRKSIAKSTSVLVLDIAEALLANADLSVSVHGTYRVQGAAGFSDLSGSIERAVGARVERYLPTAINEDTHSWLRKSLLAGNVRQGSFILRGDLAQFPFNTPREGVFRVTAPVYGVQLRYSEDYPGIEDIDGLVTMDGVRLEIQSDMARIFGARLNKVRAVIPDLEANEELLEVYGEANGPVSEFIRFANFSPVAERIDGLTEEMTASGDMNMQMSLKVPLRHTDDTTVAGRLNFANDTVYPAPNLPRLEQVSGALDFTGSSVGAQGITAHILGGAATIVARTDNGKVLVNGRGSFQAKALDTWLGEDVAKQLSGQSEWKGELLLGKNTKKLKFESSLVGLNSRLPSPLRKAAPRAAPLVFEQQSVEGGGRWSSIKYGNIASAVWTTRPAPEGQKLDRGELRFGSDARLPAEPGLQIAGYVNAFDLGGWVDVLPEEKPGQQPVNISGINLTLSSVYFLNRRFSDIAINAKLRGNLLRASVGGKEFSGNLTYRRSGEGASRLSGQFKHFTVPDPSPVPAVAGIDESPIQVEASSIPAFDVQVEELKLADQPMGKLEIIAHGVTGGLAIDQLNLIHPDSVLKMSGVWQDTGKGETRMKIDGDVRDAGKMLTRFGHANAIQGGKANFEGDVTWLGSPADFAFKNLHGALKLNAKGGQFLKVNPGAGKLLGIASLQSLPRRITLDFRDVFSDGFAFDEITSTMQLARGDLYTNDFVMKGPSATVRMSGVASLRNETVKLRVKVIPKVSDSVAVAGAILGGPVAGLGALVLQSVLKDPFGEAIAFEYLVDGSWEEPVVTRLAKPKTETPSEKEAE